MVQVQSGEVTPKDLIELNVWRAQDSQHEHAWQRAEKFLAVFNHLPAELSKPVLGREVSHSRRSSIKKLAILLALSPGGWMAYQYSPWSHYWADYYTPIGEQQKIRLADGSEIMLNTGTSLDIRYSKHERLIVLQEGEAHFQTAADLQKPARPFLVQMPEGTAQALGTRFIVRKYNDHSQISVFDGAVKISQNHISAASLVIQAGQQATLGLTHISSASRLTPNSDAWLHGMLVANNLTLAQLLAEFRRYHSVWMRCEPAISQLRVTGTFSLTELDRNLDILTSSLPIAISKVTKYWITISAA